MSKPKDESTSSTGLDRRAVIRGALAVGSVSALTGAAAAMPVSDPTAAPPVQTVITEKEWARVLARVVVNQLPQALAQVRDVRLTAAQIAEIQTAYENTLVNNMGCTTP